MDNPDEIRWAAEVLARWQEFQHPRTLAMKITLPDETWAAIARITSKSRDVEKFAADAIEAYVDEIICGEPPGDEGEIEDEGNGGLS